MPRVGKSYMQWVQLLAITASTRDDGQVVFACYNPKESFVRWQHFLSRYQIAAPHDETNLITYAPRGVAIKFTTHKDMEAIKQQVEAENQPETPKAIIN